MRLTVGLIRPTVFTTNGGELTTGTNTLRLTHCLCKVRCKYEILNSTKISITMTLAVQNCKNYKGNISMLLHALENTLEYSTRDMHGRLTLTQIQNKKRRNRANINKPAIIQNNPVKNSIKAIYSHDKRCHEVDVYVISMSYVNIYFATSE